MRQAAEAPMAIAQVSVDALPADAMRLIIRVSQGEPFEDTELRFDQVQPRGLSRGRHRMNPQPAQQGQETRMVVDVVQVVHDHEEPFPRIAGPQAPEGFADLDEAFVSAEQAVETVRMHIIEAQELLGPMRAP